jgi:conjugative relaxase-like TrwC/TraI family protein
MTVSMRKMSAGKGYQYLLRSVVAGDGNRSLSTPLTRYYAETGTPPGFWLGSGVGEFGAGQIIVGSSVSEAQLQLLVGLGRDPVTGEQLGEPYRVFTKVNDRVAERVASLSPHLSDEERATLIDEIEAEEQEKGARTAVAGFDYTFSVPKSVSVLWGVADAGTQALIVDAHQQAVVEVLTMLEREIAVTRAGPHGRNGAVLIKPVVGLAATAYDHWDSRAGDPQLHTHVVVANKVRTRDDGRWRTLDSRGLFASVVAVSEHYNAVLADNLTRSFGLEWQRRDRGANRNPGFELAGVSEELIAEFSNRGRLIEEETERQIAEYAAAHHGRRPGWRTIVQMRARATLTTRPPKQVRSLADLTTDWRARAARAVGGDAKGWARALSTGGVRGGGSTPARGSHGSARGLLRADDVTLDAVSEVARATVGAVSLKRSTWRHWNLWAEASRQTIEWRFAGVGDREAAVAAIVEEAERISVALTPPELAYSPGVFRRTDGTSLFRPSHSVTYSSEEILAAEGRLLARGEDRGAPVVDLDVVEEVAHADAAEHLFSDEQVQTLATVAVSGRQVDLLIGPAGAGKTTAMRALYAAWTRAHGPDSVVGLAPSASAAQVLAEDLGVDCDNTAKWLHEHDHGRADFRKGQLVIVDESTLAGTLTLDRLTSLAARAGAKVLLVGDWAQLQAVDAGGAFPLLASARDDTPELVEVRRFTNGWEKAASLDLRLGRTTVIGTYFRNDRVRQGTWEDMLDAAYLAWREDLRAGRSSVLVTESSEAVIELNQRARAERILDEETLPSREVTLSDRTSASVGDLIVTRQNDRRIHALRGGWVRNGDRWRITDVLGDGSIVAHRLGASVAGSVLLPAAYAAEHVDLGYAITAHRAQGMTVDTAHVVATGSTTRENFYVAMTRGRESNIAYVALDRPDDSHAAPSPEEVTGRTILFGVLRHSGVEMAAHQAIEAEHEQWSSFAQVAAEYLTIAAEAQRDRWVAELQAAGLSEEQRDAILASESFGPLAAELRRAEATGHALAVVLPRVVAHRSLADADDIGAVLISRLRHQTSPSRRGMLQKARLIAGLIPVADGPMDPDMRRALVERQELMEARATALAEAAASQRARWLRKLGEPPTDPTRREQWLDQVRVVAAYRDRYDIDSTSPVGADAITDAQRLDAARARQAVRRAATIDEKVGDDLPTNQLEPGGPLLT